ncbi:hypothetical protein [Caballeronia glebae]|uniref:hypothetical protein n=1 Tax=Caballeronia glebae TaxID=1777143 RepID=UPI0038BCC63C
MLITLSGLLEWHDRLPEQSVEEAQMVRALIALREAELRTRIADLIALVSERENWKLQRCAAIARRVEQTPVQHLESIQEFFENRDKGYQRTEASTVLSDLFADEIRDADAPRTPLPAPAAASVIPPMPTAVVNLHHTMGTLESRVAGTPGVACGLPGVRIMRVVALMSKARSAKVAKIRMSGKQMFYRHS